MKRSLLMVAVVSLLGLPALNAQAPGTAAARPVMPDWNTIMFPMNRQVPMDRQRKDPTKLFDKVYSVGVRSVNAFLITTGGGLVLVDTTNPETADIVLDNIRKAGFDPADLKYIFSTHAAPAHYGGVGRIKQVAPAARIGMPLADWVEVETQVSRLPPGHQRRPDHYSWRHDVQVLRAAGQDTGYARHRVSSPRRRADVSRAA